MAALFINLITIAIIIPLRRRPALIKGYNSDVKGLVLNFTKVPVIRVIISTTHNRTVLIAPPSQGNEFNDFAEGKIGYLRLQQLAV